jgi:hypothetical protein
VKELTLVVMVLSPAFAIQQLVYFDDIGISFIRFELIVCTIEAQYQSSGLLGFASTCGHLSVFGLRLIETYLKSEKLKISTSNNVRMQWSCTYRNWELGQPLSMS